MMANPYDQFDEPVSQASAPNPYDQFDNQALTQPQGAAPQPQTSQTLGVEQGLSHVGQNVYNGLGWLLRQAGVDVPMVQDTQAGKQEAATFNPTQNGGQVPGRVGNFIGEQIGASPSMLLGPYAGGALNAALTTNATTPQGVAEDAALGAATSKVGQLATSGLSRIIAPQISPAVQKLRDLGIPLTIGQTLGGFAHSIEDKAQSLPLIGDAIAAARQRSIEGMNRALANGTLGTIGQTLPDNVPVGRPMIQHISDALGSEYDRILSAGTGAPDQQLASDLQAVVANAKQSLAPPQFARFQQVFNNQIGKFGNAPTWTGDVYKSASSELNRLATAYRGDQSVDVRDLGSSLSDLNGAIKASFARNNPTLAPDLANTDAAYANYARLRDAASRAGSVEGVITPSTLQQAVRAGDKSVGKGNFAKGQALMQDISDAAKSVIPSKVPDSGTAGRMMLDAGAIGAAAYGGAIHPAIPLGVIGGLAAYSRPGQSLLTSAIAGAPQPRQAAADWLARLANPVLVGAMLRSGVSGTGILPPPIP